MCRPRRGWNRSYAAACCLALLAGLTGPAAGAPAAALLEGGAVVARELAPGQRHLFWVRCQAGQLLRLSVEHQGMDVVLSARAPGGKELARVESPGGAWAPEELRVAASAAGSYEIEVAAAPRALRAGRYAIRLREQRRQRPEDARALEAQSAAAEGRRLKSEGTPAARARAIDRMQVALALWHQEGDRLQELGALDTIAQIQRAGSEDQRALETHLRALALAGALGDRRWLTTVRLDLGDDLTNLERPKEALAHLEQAQRLARAAGDRLDEAHALTSLGQAQGMLGDKQGELQAYERARALLKTVHDPYLEGLLFNRLGGAHDLRGERQQALECYRLALAAWREIRNRTGETQTLGNLGVLYALLGDDDQARSYFDQALTIARATGNRYLQGVNLTNIGDLLARSPELGRLPLSYYNQALRLFRELGDRNGEATVLESLGQLHDDLGEPRVALGHLRAALAIRRSLDDAASLALALHGLGKAQASAGQVEQALAAQQEALAIGRRLQLSDLEASALHAIARLQLGGGDLGGARRSVEAALAITERLGGKVPTRELQTSYLAYVHSYYQTRVDVLMKLHERNPDQGWDARALEANEAARARGLLETLAQGGVDLRAGVDPALAARQRQLRADIDRAAERQVASLQGTQSADQAAALNADIRKLGDELTEVQAQIRRTSPGYAALVYPQAVTLAAIQRQVLDPDTVLLEYALGDQRSTLFVASAQGLNSRPLPARRPIEAAARRLYQQLQAGQATAEAVAALSEMILGPAGSLIGGKRLLVVADGTLQYIPFAALREPGAAEPRPALVAGHEIVQAVSAATVALLRRQSAGRAAPARTAAIFADPVFDSRDPRVVGGASRPAAEGTQPPPFLAQRALARLRGRGGDGRIPRLPFTRREAEVFSDLLPADQIQVALDFEARRSLATSPLLAQFKVVHIATHGLYNEEHPGLSGLVLSLVDERGAPIDGFLSLDAIYNLRLPVDLVVLSACQTALGKPVRGEGLVGLTRGFLHAGARAVLASLWKVDDAATARLMEVFYRGLLRDGLVPSAALRAAQVEVASVKRWSLPFYWAGFVLQGDWR